MREILFRGKRLDNGEWVKGFITAACARARRLYFIEQPAQDLDDCNHSYEVDFTTVGQYTSMLDKNGNKIFEGDILKFVNDDSETSYYDVAYSETDCRWIIRENGSIPDDLDDFVNKYMSVVGNVYDNPELLKGALK